MATKEDVVSTLADAKRLLAVLKELGFYAAPRLLLTCPNRNRSYYNEGFECQARKRPDTYKLGPCVLDWEKIGVNSECPLDQKLKTAFDEARRLNFDEVLAANLKFSLMEPVKSGAYEIGVADVLIRTANTFLVNEFFQLTYDDPRAFFIVVDLELKSRLKALHQIKRLWSEMPKAVPILVTKAEGVGITELFKSQGIHVYPRRLEEYFAKPREV